MGPFFAVYVDDILSRWSYSRNTYGQVQGPLRCHIHATCGLTCVGHVDSYTLAWWVFLFVHLYFGPMGLGSFTIHVHALSNWNKVEVCSTEKYSDKWRRWNDSSSTSFLSVEIDFDFFFSILSRSSPINQTEMKGKLFYWASKMDSLLHHCIDPFFKSKSAGLDFAIRSGPINKETSLMGLEKNWPFF